jgi:hypothetical protein
LSSFCFGAELTDGESETLDQRRGISGDNSGGCAFRNDAILDAERHAFCMVALAAAAQTGLSRISTIAQAKTGPG